MEFFTKSDQVKLRSHLNKFLVADDDQETIRQSRKGDSRRAVWTVETVVDKPHLIRLRSCHGTYLTASNKPLLLGMTGEKVTQTTSFNKAMDWQTQWEPERDGFQVKLKSWCGKWLRANGGTPPWRNSVTHDEPHTSKTKNWLIWDVVNLQASDLDALSDGDESSVSSHPDVSDIGSEPESPAFAGSNKSIGRFSSLGLASPRWSLKPKTTSVSFNESREPTVSAMEFFQKAKAVRMRNSHNKYLVADDDEETVTQDRNGSSKNARWIVEPVRDSYHVIRLKSCYGKYLTASNERFLLGATGKKVIQLKPSRLDSSVEWEPVREGSNVKIKLRTRHGNYLRANGGLPPYRNSVTHDTPHLSATQDSISWEVDIVEILADPKFLSEAEIPTPKTPPPPPHRRPWNSHSRTPSSLSDRSDPDSVESPPKADGRTIYYHIADEEGHVEDESTVGYAFTFKGNSVEQLTQTLREETCLEDAVVCTRSPLNGKLFPLRLQLPPNNGTLHVVLVPSGAAL